MNTLTVNLEFPQNVLGTLKVPEARLALRRRELIAVTAEKLSFYGAVA